MILEELAHEMRTQAAPHTKYPIFQVMTEVLDTGKRWEFVTQFFARKHAEEWIDRHAHVHKNLKIHCTSGELNMETMKLMDYILESTKGGQ